MLAANVGTGMKRIEPKANVVKFGVSTSRLDYQRASAKQQSLARPTLVKDDL